MRKFFRELKCLVGFHGWEKYGHTRRRCPHCGVTQIYFSLMGWVTKND
jgi:hypothetical protein